MTTPASAEPTEVDYERAADVTTVLYGDGVLNYDQQDLAHEVIARALASQRAEIVARYEKVAAELATLAEQATRPGGGFPFETGVRITAEDAAKRIREAAPE